MKDNLVRLGQRLTDADCPWAYWSTPGDVDHLSTFLPLNGDGTKVLAGLFQVVSEDHAYDIWYDHHLQWPAESCEFAFRAVLHERGALVQAFENRFNPGGETT